MQDLLKSMFRARRPLRPSFGRFAQHSPLANGQAVEMLERKTLLASQLVASELTTTTVTPGSTIEVPVRYSTLDDNGDPAALRATLISANLHFDSDVLTFVESTDIFAEDIVVVPNATRPESDAAVTGDDNDADTDTVIVSAYSDTPTPINPENTGWPNNPSVDGILLYTARFTVNAGFTGTTDINFSANATGNVVGQAASFDFQSISLNVAAAAPNTAPTFTSANSASVAENQTSAIDVNATDVDNDTITYSISGGADASLFSIVPATGVVTFNTAPDFEAPADAGTDNIYNIVVTADDGNGGSTNQSIAVTVTDVADNGNPSITSPASVSVAENQTAVITVVASDPENDPLTFSLTGTDASLFSISTTGVITFNTAPDFEAPADSGADNVYNVTVGVSDDNNGSTSQNLAITVTDVRDTNDNPVITSSASASVAENQTAAISVVATDGDGDTLTYSLSGTDASLFSVSATGVITFNAAPDFEAPADAGANNVYDVTVGVGDGNGGSASQNIAITVTDVRDTNENPVITSGASASVAENQTAAITVVATDSDGDTLTYSLTGPDAALFSISSSGVITFDTAPDFETPADDGGDNVYNVTANVTDGNNGSAAQNIAITVTDVTETGTGTIEGRKFNDENGNGTRDSSEPFLNGWTIQLVDAAGNIVQEQVTADSDLNNDGTIDPETERGHYQFTVDVGTYTVQEVLQDGWVQTAPSDSVAVAAFELDTQLGLNQSINDFEDWGGLGEKWIWADGGQWYYITPDGSVFEWDGSPRTNLTGTLQETLSPEYHDDTTLLTSAQPATAAAVDVATGQTVTVDFGNQRIDDPVDPPGSFVGSGNIDVRIVRNRHLILTGDAEANGVRVFTNASGQVAIQGLGDTTVEGLTTPYVIDAWTSIPGDLRSNLYGGDDAILVQDVGIGRHAIVNTHQGNDFVLMDNVSTTRSVYLRSNWGDNTVVLQNSQIGNLAHIITGSGNDMVSMDNTTVGGPTIVRANAGDDLFVTQDSSYGRGTWYDAGRGNDQVVVEGTNSFGASVSLNGRSGSDAVNVSSSTTFATPVRVRNIEQDSISDINDLLDSVMTRLSEAGLGDLI